MSYTWVEPFAGAAAVALRLVGGRDLTPPVAWMGGKRRYARVIADAMGVPPGPPARVVLCDAGPWGWVWPLLLEPGSARDVAGVLRLWQDRDPQDLWEVLVGRPPAHAVAVRAAQWLWIQARTASNVPAWWDGWRTGEGTRWEQGSAGGRPPQPIGQRGEWRMGEEQKKSARGTRTISQKGLHGMVNPATISDRIEAVCDAFARVEGVVLVGPADATDVDPLSHCQQGWDPVFVYLDPPYAGATGYGWDCPRESVLELARGWQGAGAVVAVSEAEPLELPGWHHLELTREGGKPEFLTLSRPPVVKPIRQAEFEWTT